MNRAALEASLSGRYRIERELGTGGMATVYQAWDESENRQVALKVLLPELASNVGAERFLREIRIGATLTHPHILTLHESGQAGEVLYYTMPVVEGETLRERLDREGQLPIEESLTIARQVASALDYAHEHGVVHRDIKPENIMLSEGGAVVMDFGIARAIDSAGGEKLTETGLAMGTPAYMSPEQAEGRDRLDGRSDQYSLACVLYEMLAGHPPFGGPTSQVVLNRAAKDPVPSLSSARPTVSVPVEAVIQKALSKVAADRFPTAEKFVDALELAEHGVTPRGVTPPGTTARGPRPINRTGVGRRLAIAATLAIALAALGYVLLPGRDSEAIADVGEVPPDAGPFAKSVVPFRADADLADLGEVVARLLPPRINPDGVGPDVAGLLEAWRGSGAEHGSSASRRTAARRLAVELGTPLVVVGTLTGTRASFTMSAEMVGVETGHPVARGSVRGSEEDLAGMVVELAAQLLGRAPEEKLSEVPRPALEAYVEGLRTTRHDPEAAVRHFETALELDPTFGSAAYERLYELRHLQESGSRTGQTAYETWALRDEMSERERAYLTIDFGPRGPGSEEAPFIEKLRLAEETAHAHPDVWEAWQAYGRLLALDGGVWEGADWARRVVNAMDTAIALAPPWSTVTRGMKQIRYWRALRLSDPDSALLREYGREWINAWAEWTPAKAFARWFVGHTLPDSSLVAAARGSPSFREIPLDLLIRSSAFEGLPLEDAEERAGRRDARTARQAFFGDYDRVRVAVLRGDGAAAAAAWRGMDEADVSDWFVRTQLATIALFDPAWRELATGAIGPFFEPRDTIPGQREWPRNFDSPEDRLCVRELWGFLVRGERGRPHLRRANLAAVTWDDGVPALRRYEQMGRGFCNAAMEALEETAADPAGPAPALARLDTLMMNRPFNGWFPASGNLVLARLHERRGDRDAALAALRRPKNENQGGDLLATIYLREEGRLARATGDIDGAIRVYRHYLLLRRAPDEVTWPQVDSVCAELRDISETAADAYSICRHGRAESLGGAS